MVCPPIATWKDYRENRDRIQGGDTVISKFKYKAHVSAICLTCLAVPALAQEPVQTGGWQDKIKTDIRVTLQYITEEIKISAPPTTKWRTVFHSRSS